MENGNILLSNGTEYENDRESHTVLELVWYEEKFIYNDIDKRLKRYNQTNFIVEKDNDIHEDIGSKEVDLFPDGLQYNEQSLYPKLVLIVYTKFGKGPSFEFGCHSKWMIQFILNGVNLNANPGEVFDLWNVYSFRI